MKQVYFKLVVTEVTNNNLKISSNLLKACTTIRERMLDINTTENTRRP